MTYEIDDLLERLAKCEERGKSNTHRIDKLVSESEGLNKALNRMATAVEILANEQKHALDEHKNIGKKVDEIDVKVSNIELAPAREAVRLRNEIIKATVSALFGAIFGAIISFVIR